MGIPLDEFDTIGGPRKVERGRGGFWRHPTTDAPYVSDPSGALVKSGERKGQCARLMYGSPSGFGDLIDDTTAIEKFDARCAIYGLADLPAELSAFHDADMDDPQVQQDAWRLFRFAADWGGAKLGANRGTLFHAYAHDDHLGRIDRRAYAEQAEQLGLLVTDLDTALASWKLALDVDGLEVLAMEVPCVNDHYRQAGTLDCIARLTRDLHFVDVNGVVHVITAGTVLVLDIKTGKRRTTAKGVIEYWQSYAVQIAAYAGSVPYDNDTETRGEWEWEIDQRYGLIAHVDLLGAMRGEPSTTLVLVDLVAGRAAADLCIAAKEWGKRPDVFAVGATHRPAMLPALDRDALVARYNALGVDLQERFKEKAIPKTDLAAIAAALDELEHPPTVVDMARERMARERMAREVSHKPGPVTDDEGGPADEGDVNAAKARFELGMESEQRAWTGAIVRQSIDAGRDIRVTVRSTQRRADIYTALTKFATSPHWDADSDEGFRAAVYVATGDASAFWPTLTLGDALGQLDAVQARELRDVVDAIATDLLVATVDEATQTLRWVRPPAA